MSITATARAAANGWCHPAVDDDGGLIGAIGAFGASGRIAERDAALARSAAS